MADVQPAELLDRLRAPNPPLILDVRSAAEFAAGHVPGAINIPFSAVPFRAGELGPQPDVPIIVYCGGGTCELSMNLAWAMLNSGQQKLLVFMGGTPEWEGAGFPLERSAGAQ